MALRVAICISGFIRHQQLSSLNTYVIEPNFPNGVQFDVFAHVWSELGVRRPVPEESMDARADLYEEHEFWSRQVTRLDLAPVDQGGFRESLRALNVTNTTVTFGNYSVLASDWAASLETQNWNYTHGKTKHQVLSKLGMWHGIQSSFRMIPDPSKYDFIIRTRPDIEFTSGPILFRADSTLAISDSVYHLCKPTARPENSPSSHVRAISTRLGVSDGFFLTNIMVPLREYGYVDDMFAIGQPPAMSVYAEVFDTLFEVLQVMFGWSEPLESESIVVYQALRNHINLVLFPINFRKA